jgi:alpha-galactosidase
MPISGTNLPRDPQPSPLTTRRDVLRGIGAITCAGAAITPSSADHAQPTSTPLNPLPQIIRQPDQVKVFGEDSAPIKLTKSGASWSAQDIHVAIDEKDQALQLTATAPSTPLTRIHLRWHTLIANRLHVLGDAWERSYGELGWQQIVPEQPMPWYFLLTDGRVTHGIGVQTGASAFAFWQCDLEGISLWLDTRNGGRGVQLGRRTLNLATILVRQSAPGEDSFAAAQAFCRILSPTPRLPQGPIYGSNDWYYAYGKSSAKDILRDADLMAELAPTSGPRPFTVLDEGWEHNPLFPSMSGLAAQIRARSVRPGIWVRPLRARGETDKSLLLPAARFGHRQERDSENLAWDPTIPEARKKALDTIRLAVEWKYELVKHDFTTFDLLGQWGNEMGPSPTLPGWSFHDRSQTNAEIIRNLYQDIRQTAGEQTLIVGCNVVGHLSAGTFDAQRTGDDVSGKIWERTRRMGVNTLAFRLPQHNTFFAMDPDCIPITKAIPWPLTNNWLNAVANAGAALVVSPSQGIMDAEKKAAVRTAFAIAATQKTGATPANWLDSRTPEEWKTNNSADATRYEWLEPEGAYPFEI